MYESVPISFSTQNLIVLNGILAGMIFGVSMGLKGEDLLRVIRKPKAPVAGLIAQFLLLPAATGLLTWWFGVEPELALGMILIASCPGGTFSNIMTWIGRASVPVSISMTAVSSLAAIVMTPLNFALYGYLNPLTRPLLQDISLEPLSILTLVALVLVIPMLLGMAVGKRHPQWAERAEKPMRVVTLMVFVVFVAIAFINNQQAAAEYADEILIFVALQNLGALLLGDLASRTARLPQNERRAVTMEVGIQNSALGLSIIFTFFPNAGGMMLIAGFWSFWHLLVGLLLALYWSKTAEATCLTSS
ncbi:MULTISPECIES: bile acid:sodium symporter family protein [Spongiibacter]|uniref:bile acid:sodium symporter family protein n=1 Tax=Spongiibacter TaxID=630749 RepID=UPI000C3B318E|nr:MULTISPECIES: bile acid:sodium symporter family protein [Spongiibacter]MAY40571.1 bile acid:sodium symporter [Spongiibacter sp.]MBO6752464.1 bile acid:sodium symporter family protein [Spongiibacter sp.]MBU72735.1 bile acid:sodium symporter [Spongiibacter sp.]|tara:strand:+ start:27634 stop:28545 length:912 start_codon:yes stop_codon:yes gene_type:complete